MYSGGKNQTQLSLSHVTCRSAECFCQWDLRPDRPCPGPDQQLASRTLYLCSTPSLDQEVDLRDTQQNKTKQKNSILSSMFELWKMIWWFRCFRKSVNLLISSASFMKPGVLKGKKPSPCEHHRSVVCIRTQTGKDTHLSQTAGLQHCACVLFPDTPTRCQLQQQPAGEKNN